MNSALLWSGAAIMVVTAVTHSIFGERRLIIPLRELNQGVMARQISRDVMRLAWHGTSILMVALAYVLAYQAQNPATAQRPVVWAIGLAMTGFGLLDAIISKGRHVGWPLLTAAGVCALVSLF
jgi:hypothetical protein